MEALTQLCDLISNNPTPNSSKIAWICKRCPQPESLLSGSPRVSCSQLNAVLEQPDSYLNVLIMMTSALETRFWSLFVRFRHRLVNRFGGKHLLFHRLYRCCGIHGGIVFAALDDGSNELGISRAFLVALAESFPQIILVDVNKLVTRLLDSYLGSCPSGSSGNVGVDGSSTPSGGDNNGVPNFKEEAMEMLEKQDIAFKLIERVLDKVQIDPGLLERVRLIAKEQLRIMTSFLKV
ncbi:putative 1-phosphatidylinositol 4-kinase [Helianthus anomalus]